jgi:hypothetical protein
LEADRLSRFGVTRVPEVVDLARQFDVGLAYLKVFGVFPSNSYVTAPSSKYTNPGVGCECLPVEEAGAISDPEIHVASSTSGRCNLEEIGAFYPRLLSTGDVTTNQ